MFKRGDIKNLKGKLLKGVQMKRYTTFRVGPTAAFLYHPDSAKSLIACVNLCKDKKKDFLIIGSGSNMILKDSSSSKLFIKLSTPAFRRIEICGNEIAFGAGVSSNMLCNIAEKNLLTGCEFLVGIPGTIGGAIIQNAGAHKSCMADVIKNVKCLDKNGRVFDINRKDIDFHYRGSGLDKLIMIGATVSLKKAKHSSIHNRINMHMHQRLLSQDYSAPSAGCIFKNPKNAKFTAGELIDRSNLKGRRIGDALVSKKHANFIINKGNAVAGDILSLIKLIKAEVKKNFQIKLEEEVRIIE